MKNILLTICATITICATYAQNRPIDFEVGGNGANWTWTVFENDTNPALEIVPNPDMSGINTSATVAKFTALQTGQPFAGVESNKGGASSDLGLFSIDTSNNLIHIMVWKSKISNVGIKLVNPTFGSEPEILIPNTLTNQWEMLTFDVSVLNPINGPYDQIVIFPDFDARTQDEIIYFDNVYDVVGGGGSTLSQIDLPITFDDTTVNYNMEDFAGNSSSVVVDPTDPGNMVAQAFRDSAALTFAGTTMGDNSVNSGALANAIPFSAGNTTMTVRVWSPDAGTPVMLKIENAANGATFVEAQDTTTIASDWETLEFDFSDPTSGTPVNFDSTFNKLSIFFNFGTAGSPATAKTYYWDDVTFGSFVGLENFEANDVNIYPNPATNNLFVASNHNIDELVILNVLGKTVKTLAIDSKSAEISINDLSNGTYFIKLRSGQNIETRKIIKQ